jgi:hypothetical protein
MLAGILREAAQALEGMPRETFDALKVREFLPDELQGLSLMLANGSFVLSPMHPEREGRLPAHTEEYFDAIDAGFFSGDTFHNEDALDRFAWYVARWQREIINIRELLEENARSAEEAAEAEPGAQALPFQPRVP